MEKNQELMNLIKNRYATKLFDGKKIPQEKLDELFEMIQYAPSSFGLQPWVVKVVDDEETKEALLPASWNQPQINTASHILIFLANTDIRSRIDKYEQMLLDSGATSEKATKVAAIFNGFEEGLDEAGKKSWSQKQIYLAVENALLGAKALGFDSCPMEGFSPEKYSEILKLPKNLIPTVVVPIGYAADEPRPKIRYPKKDLFI